MIGPLAVGFRSSAKSNEELKTAGNVQAGEEVGAQRMKRWGTRCVCECVCVCGGVCGCVCVSMTNEGS
jgi:hypothetical protein